MVWVCSDGSMMMNEVWMGVVARLLTNSWMLAAGWLAVIASSPDARPPLLLAPPSLPFTPPTYS